MSHSTTSSDERIGVVRRMIQEVADDSWLFFGKLLISRQSVRSSDLPCWESGNGDFFTISQAPFTTPQGPSPAPQPRPATFETHLIPARSQPCPQTPFTLIEHDPTGMVWGIGEARMTIQHLPLPRFATEHPHLEYVQSKGDMGFLTPPILFKAEIDGRMYVLTGNLPGSYLGDVWHTLQPAAKDYYVEQTANMVQRLSEFQSEELCAFDKGQVNELYMNAELDSGSRRATNEELTRLAKTWDMDCSTFHFCVNDLSPWNIVVNGTDNPIGVSHWGMAGFYPKAWARTKLSMLRYANLDPIPETEAEFMEVWSRANVLYETDIPGSEALRDSQLQRFIQRREEEQEWRAQLQKRLGENGFPESSREYRHYICSQAMGLMPQQYSALLEYTPNISVDGLL